VAIVIMKEKSLFLAGSFHSVREPHSVFDGTIREAKAFCEDLNAKATLNRYYPVRVKLDKLGDTE